MDRTTVQRGVMALIGGLAGISLYLLGEVLEQRVLPDRAALALTAFAAVFFGALLGMTGPLPVRRALPGAVGVAVAVAGLLVIASLRFAEVEALFNHPGTVLAALVLATVPLPFYIAACGPGWRDYPSLFTQAWTIVVRYAGAWLFVGVVWIVLFLSDALLSIVGLTLIERLITEAPVAWLITGVTLGLALAVVTEMSDLVSPYLVLRLLRLLLPVVLVVMSVFIVALPVQGLSGLFGGLSVAVTLLAMAAASATLVTTAIDQGDEDAVAGPVMQRATQALALILPVPAALAAWAVWQRIAQYGWTPDRVFGAVAVALALGYGLFYAAAVLRGHGWMPRIRQANATMALALIGLSAAWLTPLLNAEAISARDQLARYVAGQVTPARLDLAVLRDWGRPGEAALAELARLAAEPGHEALAERLAASPSLTLPPLPETPDAVLAALRQTLPVQPAGSEAARDRFLAGVTTSEQSWWLQNCENRLEDGRPGCVMVVGDFWPMAEGPEALLILNLTGGGLIYEGLVTVDGLVQRRNVAVLQGSAMGTAASVIAPLQDGAPLLAPAALNQISVGGVGLLITP